VTGAEPTVATAESYRRFATYEAAGRSPAYEQLANAVAEDGLILSFLGRLPASKRQPNLLFAAAPAAEVRNPRKAGGWITAPRCSWCHELRCGY
jgi:Uncharacterized protein conserved in bacteria (DUF2332)